MLKFFIILIFLLISISSYAEKTKDMNDGLLKIISGDKEIRFSGYMDSYYAYDLHNPYEGEKDFEQGGGRYYTSDPLYDRQFSVGYGFLQFEFDHKNLGLRIATHFGDIVQKMYVEEPDNIKKIREASINIKLNHELLLEVGYMPSIFGFETFINKDNLHASRAFMTDFAPDFDAGARLYWKATEHDTLKFQLTNGWQVLRDKNRVIALGAAYVREKKNEYLFNWGQFWGDESLEGERTAYRYYNNIFAKIHLSDKWIIVPMLDVGWEQKVKSGEREKTWAPWQSYGIIGRYALNPKNGIAGRFDRTYDPNSIIPELKANSPHGWISDGYTLTYEYLFNELATFRVEGRYVKSRDPVFKTKNENKLTDEDSFLMSQIAVSF